MGRTRGGSGAKNGRDPNPKSLGVKDMPVNLLQQVQLLLSSVEQNSILEQML